MGTVSFAASHCRWLRSLLLLRSCSHGKSLWEPPLCGASAEPRSHCAWPQQCGFVPCKRVFNVKNGSIKSKKGIGALHSAALKVPVIRKEGFARCGHTWAGHGTLLTILVRRNKSRFPHERAVQVWRALRREQNEASKPQGHGQRSAGRELLCCLRCSSAPTKEQHWLLPKEKARPESLPCVPYALEREFLWLAQHLTE